MIISTPDIVSSILELTFPVIFVKPLLPPAARTISSPEVV